MTMKKGHQMKKWILGLITGVMLMMLAVPVSAATKGQFKVMSAGECYHVMNKNISANKITKYKFTVTKLTSDARYDMVLASYNSTTKKSSALAVKNCTISASRTNNAASYIKSTAGANNGMIACVRVLKGQVKVQIDYVTESAGSKLLTFGKMSTKHATFKGVTVAAGKTISFRRTAGNVDMPIVLAAKRGSEAKRYVSGAKTCDWFGFGSTQYRYRAYTNGKRIINQKRNYDTKYSTTGYVMTSWTKAINTNCKFKVTSGTITFFYPTDYFKIIVSR